MNLRFSLNLCTIFSAGAQRFVVFIFESAETNHISAPCSSTDT